jgi:lycopene cyclase domain-containing protein
VSYLEFLLVFVVGPAGLLVGLAAVRRRRSPTAEVSWRRHWSGVAILAVLAVVWTTPWDNYVVARGVWGYGADRVLGVIGFVPVEEYAFFVLQPLLNGALLLFLLPPNLPGTSRWREPSLVPRVSLAVFAAVAFLAAFLALRVEANLYLGLILVWFLVPLLIQWLFDPGTIRRQWRAIVLGTIIPAGYLSLADSFALTSGIWTISPATSTGWMVGNVPVEEIIFFAMTSLLLAQGLVLWHSLAPSAKPARP